MLLPTVPDFTPAPDGVTVDANGYADPVPGSAPDWYWRGWDSALERARPAWPPTSGSFELTVHKANPTAGFRAALAPLCVLTNADFAGVV